MKDNEKFEYLRRKLDGPRFGGFSKPYGNNMTPQERKTINL